MSTPIAWPEAQRICDMPEIHEALSSFSHDSTQDNAVGLICAVLNAAATFTQGRAAGLEEERSIPEEVKNALDRMCKPLHDSVLSGATAAADAYCMEVIRNYIMSTASPASDAGKDDALLTIARDALEEIRDFRHETDEWDGVEECMPAMREIARVALSSLEVIGKGEKG